MVSDQSINVIDASPSSSPMVTTTEPTERIPSFPPPSTTTVDGSASASGAVATHQQLTVSWAPLPTPDQTAAPATGQEGGRGDVCLRILCQLLHRVCTIVTYPFMVLFTLVSLILLTFFCIFPTLLCLTFGTCLYYCLMEDPIPLSVLLRYMLSPDADDTHPTSLYPMSQQRPVIQSKLIVRKLLRIDDIIGSGSETSSSEYPRKHPFPIHLSTESKCLYFSEPLDAEEDNDDGNSNSISNSNSETFRIVVVGEEEENINEPSSITMENQRPDTHGISGITDTTSDQMTSLDEGDDEDAEEEEEEEEEPPPKSEVGSTKTEPLSRNQPVPKFETKDNDNPNNEMVEIDKVDQMVVETVDEKSLSSEDDNDPSNEKKVEERAEEGTIMLNVGVDDDKKQDADEQKLVDTTMEKGDKQQQEEEEATATKTKKDEEEDYFGIYESRDRGTSCDICLLEYQVGDIIAWSPNLECTHTFHRDCVLDWLVRKPTCPICRHDYLKGKNDESV